MRFSFFIRKTRFIRACFLVTYFWSAPYIRSCYLGYLTRLTIFYFSVISAAFAFLFNSAFALNHPRLILHLFWSDRTSATPYFLGNTVFFSSFQNGAVSCSFVFLECFFSFIFPRFSLPRLCSALLRLLFINRNCFSLFFSDLKNTSVILYVNNNLHNSFFILQNANNYLLFYINVWSEYFFVPRTRVTFFK